MLTKEELIVKTKEVKYKCAKICIGKGLGHITSDMSSAELLTVLYYNHMKFRPENPQWEDRDRFIMSKNHGSAITYPILCDLGFFGEDFLNSYQENGSTLGTHSKLEVPGVEFAGGSLGIGIGVAAGMAYVAKQEQRKWRVYCLIGDCECHEGSVWEAIMFAGYQKLSNLIVFVDGNKQGCTDYIDRLLPLNPLDEKFKSFQWETFEVEDGHDVAELMACFSYIEKRQSEKPLMVYVNTIKGNGIEEMLNKPWLHGQVPSGTEADVILDRFKKEYEDAVK